MPSLSNAVGTDACGCVSLQTQTELPSAFDCECDYRARASDSNSILQPVNFAPIWLLELNQTRLSFWVFFLQMVEHQVKGHHSDFTFVFF